VQISSKERGMAKVLVIHGAGMNMRGKVQTDIFGPMTLPEYDERIRGYAAELGLEVEIFHSNIEGEIVNKLYDANDKGCDAALFNPAAFGTGYPALVAAISQVRFPTIEVHISNPVRRGPASETARVSHGIVAGFGLPGYYLALRGVRDMLASKK
jgi:3-dehydroquinate dehydratase II